MRAFAGRSGNCGGGALTRFLNFMNKLVLLGAVWLCALATVARAQQKPAYPTPAPKPSAPAVKRVPATSPQEVVREWFRRWNALDGSEPAAKRFIDLYQPTAIHQTEPSEKQIGPVYYEGHAALRKLVEDFTRAATQPAFQIDKVAAGSKSVELFFMSEGPWDGPAVGVQYTASYTDRVTKKRHSFPGFAVFHIENGKLRHTRFYTARDENVGE